MPNTMAHKFKVGDRVKVKDGVYRKLILWSPENFEGTVIRAPRKGDTSTLVSFKMCGTLYARELELVKPKKKAKPKPKSARP